MALKLHVGASALIGALERYAHRLDLLEVSTDPKSLPPPKRLRQWRQAVPDTFAFSVVLPRDVGALTSSEAVDTALGHALQAASILSARWLLLRTPASVVPSERNRRRLGELVRKLAETGISVAWDPRGVWDAEDAEVFAADLGVVLVRDLAQADAPLGPVVYTRLLALGQQSRLGQGAIERVVDRLEEAEDAYVVVEGRGAPGVARRLRAELGLDQRELEAEEAAEPDEASQGKAEVEGEESDDDAVGDDDEFEDDDDDDDDDDLDDEELDEDE